MIKSRPGKFLVQLIESVEDILRVLLKTNWRVGPVPELPKKDVVVVGNGPSFGVFLEESFSFLEGKEVFCVNHFANTSAFERVQPQHYVLLDNFFFEKKDNTAPEIYSSIKNKLTWPMRLYVPSAFKGNLLISDLLQEKSEIEIVYFNYVFLNSQGSIAQWMFKSGKAIVLSQTVLMAAVFLAIQSKCNTVYLIGADHTFHRHISIGDDNLMYHRDSHFYSKNEKAIPVIDSRSGLGLTMRVFFENMVRVYSGYEKINRFANSLGVKVVNITPGSFIDIFERQKV